MGRGRAKAKQTKVARELKYNSGGMNLDALRAELVHHDQESDDVDPELLAKYADDAEYGDGDEYEDDAAASR